MIIDCFTYYNEKELLDFHINHVYDYVDKIIVVEGDRTYDGRPYKSDFNIKDPKVEHHIVSLLEKPDTRWQNEALQRKLAGDIAKQYEGTLFFECVDEIVRTELYKEYLTPKCFVLDNFYYYFNGKDVGEKPDHPMPVAIPTKFITNLHFQWEYRSSFTQIPHAGWHFSYLGGIDRIKQKLSAYSHVENDTDEVKRKLTKNIKAGNDIFGRPDHKFEYVKIDDSFPKELVNNLKKYKDLIK
jgi:beta-1,4-mannosyl-glycoprotein beta-1,4-N-acetylglucosaminyltransferase